MLAPRQWGQLERARPHLEGPEDQETHRLPPVESLEHRLCGQVFFERQLFWALMRQAGRTIGQRLKAHLLHRGQSLDING